MVMSTRYFNFNADVNISFAFQSNVMVNDGVMTNIVSSIGWGVARVHIVTECSFQSNEMVMSLSTLYFNFNQM